MGNHHDLKIDKNFYALIISGELRFQVRMNDRNFVAGDTVTFMETLYTADEMRNGSPLTLTGKKVGTKIIYVMKADAIEGAMYPWWCVFGFALHAEAQREEEGGEGRVDDKRGDK